MALADGEKHGYDITREVASVTKGQIPLGSGTLYRQLRQLLVDGWIAETECEDADGRRRYYRLTPWGRRIAKAEAARLEEVLTFARSRRLLPA
jgi:DNA-binding PadR family transcriptional regulator